MKVIRLRVGFSGRLRRHPRWSILLVLACGGLVFAIGQALAADATVKATDNSTSYTLGTANPNIPGGGTLNFENDGSSVSHSVTANGTGPDGRPLFGSVIFSGGTRPVKGVQYLGPGNTYQFHCSVHPNMTGTLHVTGGAAVPRPQIDVAILSGSLSRVRSTRKLKTRVDAQTKSDNVSLTAKKGTKTLAHVSNIDLGASQSETVAMHLTRKGRRALKGLQQATVKLRGTVPFGAPATAKRTLH